MLGAQKNRLIETVLMNTYKKIRFGLEITIAVCYALLINVRPYGLNRYREHVNILKINIDTLKSVAIIHV